MGTLDYIAAGYVAEVDDRILAHLQIVICNKLRRNERFTLTLPPENGAKGPVNVLWFEASLPVRFTYSSPDRPAINPAWLYLLADAASGRTGLRVVPEPQPEPAAAPAQATAPVHAPARREPISA